MRNAVKKRKRLLAISVAMFMICGMALGYAALSSSLKISGTGTISANWDILFTNIEEMGRKGASSNQSEITDKLTAIFDVNIEAPGDYIEYNVTLKNNGNIDAVIESIEGIVEANQQTPTGIQFGIRGIRIGDALIAGSEKTFVVRAEILSSATVLPRGTKTLDLKVNVRQNDIDSSGLATTFKDCFQTNEAGDTITKYLCGKNNTNGYSEIFEVNIPQKINGHIITKIGSKAFSSKGLTSIIIPNTVTQIENHAFMGNQLTSLIIPDSVKTIENDAFVGNQLSEIEIPSSVTRIGFGAFRNNKMPNDQSFIYNRNSDGTENKTSLNSYAGIDTRVVLPNNIKVIGGHAFHGNSITEIHFPDQLTAIEAGAFQANYGLTQIVIPASVTTLGNSSFCDCRNLTKVEFLGDVPAMVGIGIFTDNKKLTTDTIQVPTGKLDQYRNAKGQCQQNCLPSKTWFGSEDASLLNAFYE